MEHQEKLGVFIYKGLLLEHILCTKHSSFSEANTFSAHQEVVRIL
jgi:hypothetical protein